MKKNDFELKHLRTEADWQAYHHIRRTILFEGRGRGDVYDPNHPDDRKENNYPFLLIHDDLPVGTVRVDIDRQDRSAYMRLVAVIAEEQGKGFGRVMIRLVEAFVLENRCTVLHVVPNKDAVGFYRKCGYSATELQDSEPIVMRKVWS